MIYQAPHLSGIEIDVVKRVEEARQRLRYAVSEKRVWEGVLRRVTLAKVVRASNSIEGLDVTQDDAMAAINSNEPVETSPGAEDWRATVGYRDAMTYVLQISDDPHFRFSEDLIRSLHFMMLKYDLKKHPGRWRPGAIFVRDEVAKKIVYEGPDAGQVPDLMREYVASLNDKDGTPAMIRAAMAHLNLTMIHPFTDGNGRMARIMQSLVLAREGILAPEFCSIEEYLRRETADYYDVLTEVGAGGWHPERNALPWIRFCLLAHHRQANLLIRRTEFFRLLFDEVEALTKEMKLPERMIIPLVEASIGLKVTNTSYRSGADVSLNLASRDLKTLSDAELLVPSGERRGRNYVGSRKLKDTVRSRVRLPKFDDDPFKPQQSELPL